MHPVKFAARTSPTADDVDFLNVLGHTGFYAYALYQFEANTICRHERSFLDLECMLINERMIACDSRK